MNKFSLLKKIKSRNILPSVALMRRELSKQRKRDMRRIEGRIKSQAVFWGNSIVRSHEEMVHVCGHLPSGATKFFEQMSKKALIGRIFNR